MYVSWISIFKKPVTPYCLVLNIRDEIQDTTTGW
jgi:hypothetical protein